MTQDLRHNAPVPLRSGYTTGACAAAAAKGAALMLARQETVSEVSIDLPAGVAATFVLHGQEFGPESASCHVIKDAGDDPDVTNGAEVHARVMLVPFDDSAHGTESRLSGVEARPTPPEVIITGGTGIGRATKPGLAVAPGEWAINPVPRRMITEAVHSVFSTFNIQHSTFNLSVVISIPDGEQRAKKTLNERLGIMGGLSILGTSGIVRPISAKAWTDTIDTALDVARACGCTTVVLSTGRTSEMAAQKHLKNTLPEEAFIMMGDHVAHAVRACAERSFNHPIIACQFAKLLKIACGYENTHAAASELDLSRLRQWAETAQLPTPLRALIAQAHTAREIALESGFERALLEVVCRRAQSAARGHAPDTQAGFQVADYAGNIVYYSG
jgi:cobalt-precorrin-5B (C1)-methyltransferase